jgi:hypothetical protein
MAKTAINGFLLKIVIFNLKGTSQESEPGVGAA